MLNTIRKCFSSYPDWFPILLGGLSLAGLYVVSRHDFLLFHCLAEAFSIVIAIAVFAIFWNTRQFLDSSVYLVVGFGCLFAGLLDLIYVFAYPGMSVFPDADGNLALQAKTVAQWYVSLSCVCAFLFLRRKIHQNVALLIYSVLLAAALASMLYWRIFPACLTEAQGITAFARIGALISCAAYLGTLVLLVHNRREFDGYVFKLLAAAVVAFFVQDCASAVAIELNGFARTVAHLCQIVALYFAYKVFVEVGLTKPYGLLFRRQQKSAEERQRTEDKLRRSRDQLARLADNLPGSVVYEMTGDADGSRRILYVSAGAKRVLGFTPEGIKADASLLYRQIPERYRPMLEAAEIVSGREWSLFNVEVPIVTQEGSHKWLHICSIPHETEDGQVVWDGIATDITARKQAEESLRFSEEGLRLVLEASGVGWWSLDLISGVLTADDRCKTLFGLPGTTEPSFELFLERVFPEDRTLAERQMIEATARTDAFEAEYRTTWPDGTLHWLLIKSRSYHHAPDQRVLKGIVMDVTERKRAEETVWKSERRYRSFVELTSQWAWVTDASGRVVEDIPAWRTFTGQTPQQVLGWGWADALHPDDTQRTREVWNRSLATKTLYETEYRLRRHDGVYRLFLARGVPILDARGSVVEWVGTCIDITERKQAEEALRDSEQRFRALFERSPDAVFLTIPEGQIVAANPAACSMFGMTEEEICRVGRAGLISSEDSRVREALQERRRTGSITNWQFTYRRKSGERFFGETSSVILPGEPPRAFVIVRDITQRKRAEDALKQSERFQTAVLNSLAAHIAVLNREGRIVAVNEPWLSFARENDASSLAAIGVGANYLEASRAAGIADDPYALAAIEGIEAVIQGQQQHFVIEYPCHSPDQERWFLMEVTPNTADIGGVITTHTDITERKRAEEALRVSEERHRLLIETIPQLAWRASPDGLEIDCNRRWYEYTGQTPAQVRAHGWLAPLHPDDLFRVAEAALHAATVLQSYEIEYRLRRASDGSYRWHLARIIPMLGKDGQATAWFGSATDIEELKQAHELLKVAYDEQLQRHQAELAHVARLSMLGEMAASLAHELNQPLYAMKNYAFGGICRLQAAPQRDEELLGALEQISEEATRAAEVIRRVKGFVQKRELRISEVSVNNLVEEAVLLTRMELQRCRIQVALELDPDLPVIIGDAIQIEQVILNLVRNGLEAMEQTPDNNRILGIKTMRHGAHCVQVDVRDTGQGIREADLEKMFEAFFTTKPEGMGLGLAISRSIVQAHRGRLWATVNPDHGSTVHFTLRIAQGD